jgi:hypothetical protein
MVFSVANTNDSKNNPLKVAVAYDFPNYNFRSTGLNTTNKEIDMTSKNTNNMTINYYGTQQNYHTTTLTFSNGDVSQFSQDIPDNIGFLIIHLEPTGNFNTPNSDIPEGLKMNKSIQVCFFLKSGAPQSNDIDDLLNYYDSNNAIKYTSAPTISINLNSAIPIQKNCYFYNSDTTGINTFIFDVPIIINSKSLSQNLISSSSPVYNNPIRLYKIPINSNTILTDGIYIDCNPTGESPDKLNTYNVPIGSAFDTSKGGYDLQHMTINFALFTLVLLGSYFGVPVIYNELIIKDIKNLLDGGISIDAKKINIYYDVFWGIIFFILIIILIPVGLSQNNYNITSAGLFILMFYILSVAILQTNDFNTKFRSIKLDEYGSFLKNYWNVLYSTIFGFLYLTYVSRNKKESINESINNTINQST